MQGAGERVCERDEKARRDWQGGCPSQPRPAFQCIKYKSSNVMRENMTSCMAQPAAVCNNTCCMDA